MIPCLQLFIQISPNGFINIWSISWYIEQPYARKVIDFIILKVGEHFCDFNSSSTTKMWEIQDILLQQDVFLHPNIELVYPFALSFVLSVVVSSNMIAKQLLEQCTLWQVHLSKRRPKPSWKMYDTLLLDILKDRHILLSGNIFLKSNGLWLQSRNVKSSSAILKVRIASAADTLLSNGTSKVNDDQGKAFDKEVEEWQGSWRKCFLRYILSKPYFW